ncbi:LysR family transcriptional regulator [Gordonibacter massiliensis (ex Traore et al. 2017)]|uniref:LysR family transcriptional regulator n=1 Tax=Gordonibacter massiliensis (ex Traore et al. 2017) TaxID=1841863 RepID=UPI001C8C9598|nr:LysR family transcriptional regulator [Gordonibacter massiliensis (ex Traore et al. 2017)]MBX9033994.1 LysR family transcriptional regulator [Gordonibacter massiliensis (ex Traore et al. 2017)]
MLFKQLQYFCAVARLHSFTKAAEECFISQSAISQQVKALEADLEVQLVEREGRSFRLTPAGEHLAERGREILGEVAQLRFELAGFGDDPARLRVGYLNRYEGWEVQGAVAAFALRHPHVTITTDARSHDGLYDGIRNGEFDVLVSDRRRELSDAFVNRLLFTAYSYVEVSEGSKLAWRDGVTVEQLRDAACILVAAPDQRDVERDYHRDVLNYACDFLFADTVEQAHMMVAGNRGFLPLESRADEGRSGTVLRRIPLLDAAGNHQRREYYAFWPKARTTPLIEEFADVLQGLFG